MKEIKIDKIIITIGKKEFSFTVEEIKELQAKLNETFQTRHSCCNHYPWINHFGCSHNNRRRHGYHHHP